MREVYGVHYSHATALLQQRKIRRYLRAREAGLPVGERPRFTPGSAPVPEWARDALVERQSLMAWDVVLVEHPPGVDASASELDAVER
jgi:hypothetical protein